MDSGPNFGCKITSLMKSVKEKKIPYKRKLSSLLNCDKPDFFNFVEICFLICYDQACNVVTAPSTLFGRVFMIKICDVYFYLLRWSLKNIGMLHFVADKMWILCKRAFCWCYCKHFEHWNTFQVMPIMHFFFFLPPWNHIVWYSCYELQVSLSWWSWVLFIAVL